MEKLKQLKAKKEKILADMQAMINASADGVLSDEAQKKFDGLEKEAALVQKNIKNIENMLDEQATADRTAVTAPPAAAASAISTAASRIHVPAEARRWGNQLKAFKGTDAAENAYKAGMWLSGAFGKDRKSVV